MQGTLASHSARACPSVAVVQAVLQRWEPHSSLRGSGFLLSPDSAVGDNSSLGGAPARIGWQRHLLEPVVFPRSVREYREEGLSLSCSVTFMSFSPFPSSSPT